MEPRTQLSTMLSKTCSKKDILFVANAIVANPALANELWHTVVARQPHAWRAAWALYTASEADAAITSPFLGQIALLLPTASGNGLIRELLKVLLLHPLPQEPSGKLLDFCLHAAASRTFPVSIRMYAMEMAAKYCHRYPELTREVVILLRDVAQEAPSVGTKKWACRLAEKLADSSAMDDSHCAV